MSPTKTAEPIEMLFGTWTLVGPRNHVLDRGSDPTCEAVILSGPKESCIRQGYRSHTWRGNFDSKRGQPRTCPTADILKATQQGAEVLQCGCLLEHPGWRYTLAQPGKYDWTIRLRRQYGFMSNYFDQLLPLTQCGFHSEMWPARRDLSRSNGLVLMLPMTNGGHR